jgi:thiamine-monophosphate kinase
MHLRTALRSSAATRRADHCPLRFRSWATYRTHRPSGAPAQVPVMRAAAQLRNRFSFPTPRVALGEGLRDFASACIDVSDGLFADAAKLAAASGCGIEIAFDELAVSASLVRAVGMERARHLALTGGEDYELCFAVPPARIEALERALPPARWQYRRIGTLSAAPAARVTRGGNVMEFSHSGFDHFASQKEAR